MIRNNFLTILCCFCVMIITTNAQNQGEKLFTQKCTACHTVGGGRLIGPDLANMHVRRTEEWIIKFVQASQSLIKSGDSEAKKLFEEYNGIIMPDQDLTANQIKSIIAYIAENSPDLNNPNKKNPSQIFNASSISESDIQRGKKLFEGNTTFKNGGSACIACHNINNQRMFNGGLLAKDLTTAFSRLSAAGVDGILRNPPFPAMVDAFGSNPLTDQEAKDILAFLYYTDSKGEVKLSPIQTQFDLLIGIIIGINIALGIFFLMWQRVKKYSVNFFNN